MIFFNQNLIAGKFEINISVGTKMYDSVTPVKSNEEHKENPTQVLYYTHDCNYLQWRGLY